MPALQILHRDLQFIFPLRRREFDPAGEAIRLASQKSEEKH
jgi:hypothetical protein